jgi:hypothetical protein
MASKIYTFEVAEELNVADIEQYIAALKLIKKDDTLELKERTIHTITTTRQDVATALEPIFQPATIKNTWKKTTPKNGKQSADIAEPLGLAPYQET